MDETWLERELNTGRSFESLAREVGKDASTIAYWAQKFGLRSQHAARRTAKHRIDRARLQALVAAGHSIRSMALELDVGYQTVRYWLRKYELATPRAQRLHATRAAAAEGEVAVIACPTHGSVSHRRRKEGGFRCLKCRSEAVARHRRRMKATLVADHGGHCVICGFDGVPEALHFHHLDPKTKSFALSYAGLARGLDKARAEAAKCVLLCANCHAAVESGRERVPFALDSPDGYGRAGPG